MNELEKYVSEQMVKLVPTFEKLEVRGYVNDFSYEVEFFVTIEGKRMQCYDMTDQNLIKEKELDAVNESIAKFIRQTAEYQKGKVYKILTVINR